MDITLPAIHWLSVLPTLLLAGTAMLALFWYGAEIASDSWRYKEVSWNSPARIQIYFFKTLIPVAGGLLILQGVSECMRCLIAIRTGQWTPRHADVRETENLLAKEPEPGSAGGSNP